MSHGSVAQVAFGQGAADAQDAYRALLCEAGGPAQQGVVAEAGAAGHGDDGGAAFVERGHHLPQLRLFRLAFEQGWVCAPTPRPYKPSV